MILLTGFYVDKSAARTSEFVECIRRNALLQSIERLVVFIEDSQDSASAQRSNPVLAHNKVQLIEHGRRLLFSDLFSYANRQYPGNVVAIANADIFFDDSLNQLTGCPLAGQFLALSRWDEQDAGSSVHFRRADSQDAWIFRAPTPQLAVEFHLGVPGCDNRLAHEAASVGLRVTNPSCTIRAGHLHRSRVRHYQRQDRVSGKLLHVPCSTLEEAGLMQAEKRIPQGSNVAPLDPFEAVESALREATGTELPESIWPELRAAFEREQARKTRQSRQQLAQRPLVALTSLSPDPAQFKQQQRAIRSWVAAGLCPISFNHRSELAALSAYRDVEFVCVERTSLTEFGRHYVPISEMCEFANNCTGHVLIINADIVLTCDAWKLRRAAFLAEAGLCYLIRHNHTGNLSRAKAEPYGIDGFLFHARHSQLIERSFLSMGKPFWDYWLPHAFSAKGLTVYTLEEAIAFHENHTQRWSDEDWHQCALEFDRLTGLLGADRSLSACTAMALKVRSSFDEHRALIPRAPTPIRDWVERRFSDHTPKTFFELGAHQGTDTVWLAALPGVVVHAFEPDPRNHPPHLPNVHLVRAAVSLEDGRTQLIPSLNGWNREWTYSSSIKRPANHLTRYPVTFGDPIEVATVSLDSYARKHAIGPVDFIWADIQGAERELILGAKELLSRTRYLYTEYSDDTMYEGQPTLREILALLPNFRVLELYEDDVLLENTAWVG